MKIAEIFQSLQGEGRLEGVPSIFIRTSGCNLRCQWCDTDYASWNPEGRQHSVADLLEGIQEFPERHVVVTGGEPLLAPEIEELCARLHERSYHLTVETAATVFKPLACNLASLSPKLSNSTPRERAGGRYARQHDELRWRPDVVQAFMDRGDYQLKFVLDRPDDLTEVLGALEQLRAVDPAKVLLMPQGVTNAALAEREPWVRAECRKYGFRYCPRKQIEWFGNVRGT